VASFTPSSYSSSEGATNVALTVALSYPSVQAITVHYFTTNGTAAAGKRLHHSQRHARFRGGETSKSFNVQIANDTLDETGRGRLQ